MPTISVYIDNELYSKMNDLGSNSKVVQMALKAYLRQKDGDKVCKLPS